MTIDSHHDVAKERIDSCSKLSRRGRLVVRKSTSLSLLPVPISHIYSYSKETLPFHLQQNPHQVIAKGIQTGLISSSVVIWPVFALISGPPTLRGPALSPTEKFQQSLRHHFDNFWASHHHSQTKLPFYYIRCIKWTRILHLDTYCILLSELLTSLSPFS